jgi:hypothetical protein
MQWYYLSDSHERIALSEAQFPVLAARGLLRPTTPVWRKGMSGWTACGEVKPEIFAAGVARDSDRNHSVSDSAAVKGTLIGVARTLAAYRVPVRIIGGFTLVFATALVALLTWQTWTWIKYGVESLDKGYIFMDQVKTHWPVIWIIVAIEAVTAILAIWAGCVLLRSANTAVRARQSGSEQNLTLALQQTCRYFVICVVVLLLNAIVWIGLSLWLGWDKAFPVPGAAPVPKVSV